jgi:hypothetical protein
MSQLVLSKFLFQEFGLRFQTYLSMECFIAVISTFLLIFEVSHYALFLSSRLRSYFANYCFAILQDLFKVFHFFTLCNVDLNLLGLTVFLDRLMTYHFDLLLNQDDRA